MAANDPVDTHGHTVADAQAQNSLLDPDAPPASAETPDGGPNEVVLAQSAAEVTAQMVNAAGESIAES